MLNRSLLRERTICCPKKWSPTGQVHGQHWRFGCTTPARGPGHLTRLGLPPSRAASASTCWRCECESRGLNQEERLSWWWKSEPQAGRTVRPSGWSCATARAPGAFSSHASCSRTASHVDRDKPGAPATRAAGRRLACSAAAGLGHLRRRLPRGEGRPTLRDEDRHAPRQQRGDHSFSSWPGVVPAVVVCSNRESRTRAKDALSVAWTPVSRARPCSSSTPWRRSNPF